MITVSYLNGKKYEIQYDKTFYVVGAIHRVLRKGKINKEQTVNLLNKKAFLKRDLSSRVTELWIENLSKPQICFGI